MYTKTVAVLAGFLAALLGFTVTAHAATAIDPTDGPLDIAQTIYNAIHGGHYALAAAGSLVIAVALVRKYWGGSVPFFHTNAGSALLVLAGSFGTALTASLAGGGPVTWGLLEGAGVVAFGAAGGYAAMKAIVVVPLAARLPSWAAVPLLWLFSHASDTATGVPAITAARVLGNTKVGQDVSK